MKVLLLVVLRRGQLLCELCAERVGEARGGLDVACARAVAPMTAMTGSGRR